MAGFINPFAYYSNKILRFHSFMIDIQFTVEKKLSANHFSHVFSSVSKAFAILSLSVGSDPCRVNGLVLILIQYI